MKSMKNKVDSAVAKERRKLLLHACALKGNWGVLSRTDRLCVHNVAVLSTCIHMMRGRLLTDAGWKEVRDLVNMSDRLWQED
jgi:hypothetical protein